MTKQIAAVPYLVGSLYHSIYVSILCIYIYNYIIHDNILPLTSTILSEFCCFPTSSCSCQRHWQWPTNHKINLDIRKDITNPKSWKYKHTHVGWMGGYVYIYINKDNILYKHKHVKKKNYILHDIPKNQPNACMIHGDSVLAGSSHKSWFSYPW